LIKKFTIFLAERFRSSERLRLVWHRGKNGVGWHLVT